jgi:hypothetical protein
MINLAFKFPKDMDTTLVLKFMQELTIAKKGHPKITGMSLWESGDKLCIKNYKIYWKVELVHLNYDIFNDPTRMLDKSIYKL